MSEPVIYESEYWHSDEDEEEEEEATVGDATNSVKETQQTAMVKKAADLDKSKSAESEEQRINKIYFYRESLMLHETIDAELLKIHALLESYNALAHTIRGNTVVCPKDGKTILATLPLTQFEMLVDYFRKITESLGPLLTHVATLLHNSDTLRYCYEENAKLTVQCVDALNKAVTINDDVINSAKKIVERQDIIIDNLQDKVAHSSKFKGTTKEIKSQEPVYTPDYGSYK